MRCVLVSALAALHRFYMVKEDSKTAYRSSLVVFSGGPLLNVGALCEVLGVTSYRDWRLSSDYRIEFYAVSMIVLVLISLVLWRVAPYDAVVSEAKRMKHPRLVLCLTLTYLVGSVFAPLLVLMAIKSLGW
jgi:hypothetical protein